MALDDCRPIIFVLDRRTVDELVHGAAMLVTLRRGSPAAPLVLRRPLADPALARIAVYVRGNRAHLHGLPLRLAVAEATLPHRPRMVAASVAGRRVMMLQRLHELARMKHAVNEGLLERLEVTAPRNRAVGRLPERLPLLQNLIQPSAAIKTVDLRQQLPLADLVPLFEKDIDVDVVRHHAPTDQPHAGEILHAHQQLNKAVLLLLVEEERPMRDPAHQMIAPPRLELPLLSHSARSISHHDLTRNDIFTATYSLGSVPPEPRGRYCRHQK